MFFLALFIFDGDEEVASRASIEVFVSDEFSGKAANTEDMSTMQFDGDFRTLAGKVLMITKGADIVFFRLFDRGHKKVFEHFKGHIDCLSDVVIRHYDEAGRLRRRSLADVVWIYGKRRYNKSVIYFSRDQSRGAGRRAHAECFLMSSKCIDEWESRRWKSCTRAETYR